MDAYLRWVHGAKESVADIPDIDASIKHLHRIVNLRIGCHTHIMGYRIDGRYRDSHTHFARCRGSVERMDVLSVESCYLFIIYA